MVGEGLEGLEVHRRGVQARPERRRRRADWPAGRPRGMHAGVAAGVRDREAAVLFNNRLHLRQLDVLVNAERFGGQVG